LHEKIQALSKAYFCLYSRRACSGNSHLAILATIAFLAFNGYSADARDAVRKENLSQMNTAF